MTGATGATVVRLLAIAAVASIALLGPLPNVSLSGHGVSAPPRMAVPTVPPAAQPAGACGPTGCSSAAPGVRPSSPAISSSDNSWTRLTPSGAPPELAGAAMVFDAADGYFLVFGGEIGPIGSESPGNLTWAYTTTTNSWSNLSNTRAAPPASSSWAMAYDAIDQEAIAFGDGSGHTWAFHQGKWSDLVTTTAPPAVTTPCMTYDAQDGYVLMFGGYGAGAALNQTWSFVGGTWVNRTGSVAPPAADSCSLTDDPAIGSVVEFGGYTNSVSNPLSNLTWSYQAGSWTFVPQATAPHSRNAAAMTYVPGCECVLLYGGYWWNGPSYDTRGDTWLLENRTWVSVNPTSTPGSIAYSSIAFGVGDNDALLFGGVTGSIISSSTWAFSDPLNVTLAPTTGTFLDVNATVSLVVNVTGGVAPFTPTWSASPAHCTVTASNAANCKFPSTGIVGVTVQERDAGGYVASLQFKVLVLPALSVGLAIAPENTDVGRSVNVTVTATGGTGSPGFTWTSSAYDALGCPVFPNQSSPETVMCTPTAGATFTAAVVGTDSSGYAVDSPGVHVAIDPAPVATVIVDPTSVTAGGNVTIATGVVGGTAPFTYRYTGLPTGCASQNVSSMTCAFSANATVTVSVVDAVGARATASATENVTPTAVPSSPTPSGGSSGSSLDIPLLLGGVVGAVVIVAVAVALRRRPPNRSGRRT